MELIARIKRKPVGVSKANYTQVEACPVRSHEATSRDSTNGGHNEDAKNKQCPGDEDCSSDSGDDRHKLQVPLKKARYHGFWSSLKFWVPEILASILSLAALVAMILVLYTYNNRASSNLHLPTSLTLNGLVAALSTLNRAFLMAPIASAIMQELWLHYADASIGEKHPAQLRDMDVFSAASRGTLGSLSFLYHASAFAVLRRKRYV